MAKPNLTLKSFDEKAQRQVRDIPKDRKGTAAYNFIPLSGHIFGYPAQQGIVDFSDLGEGNTGYIDCTLKTLTELYIGSGREGQFFSPTGEPRIPGSTLRGLLRQMVSIMAYGKLSQIDGERRLFTRPMADMDKYFREWYQSQLTEEEPGETRKSYTGCAGYLYRDPQDKRYYIRPAKRREGRQFQQVKRKIIERDLGISRLRELHTYRRPDGSYYVTSGPAPRKKREWKINPPDREATAIPLSDQDIQSYEKDCQAANPSRKVKINILETYKRNHENYPDGYPVFYVVFLEGTKQQYVTFGHTGLFRIAYPKTIGDHVWSVHRDPDFVDVAERLFGRIVKTRETNENTVGSFAGLVSVSDGVVDGSVGTGEKKEVLLSGPKPTSFQNYLVQLHANKDGKNHWGKSTWLRGHKLYWHHPIRKLTEDEKKQDKMLTVIRPLPAGSNFKFRIYFQGLTNFELGALLSAVDLPEGLAHKLGMGKAWGYGSVRIEGRLTLQDPRQRYQSLFKTSNWSTGTRPADKNAYKKAFQATIYKYVSDLERRSADSYWGLYRLRQLRKLLDLNQGEQNWKEDKLREQDFRKESRQRKVLPLPEDV